MSLRRQLSASLVVLSFTACQDPSSVTPAGSAGSLSPSRSTQGQPASATGGGWYDISGLPVKFSFSAVQFTLTEATGHFRIYADEGDGLTVDVAGDVICMTQDPVNHRAWIGAVITRNESTDPTLQTDIHEVGDDVWFRVLDSGEGSDAGPDRTSFTGFKGSAGIQTSQEYCAVRLWAENNARTWPVTSGDISVRP